MKKLWGTCISLVQHTKKLEQNSLPGERTKINKADVPQTNYSISITTQKKCN